MCIRDRSCAVDVVIVGADAGSVETSLSVLGFVVVCCGGVGVWALLGAVSPGGSQPMLSAVAVLVLIS